MTAHNLQTRKEPTIHGFHEFLDLGFYIETNFFKIMKSYQSNLLHSHSKNFQFDSNTMEWPLEVSHALSKNNAKLFWMT